MAEYDHTLLIDRREKDEEVLAHVEDVAEDLGVPYSYEHLETGDYVYNDAAVEHKDIDDAVKSTVNDRIYRQADAMAKEYRRAFVGVVGKMREVDTDFSGVSYAQSYGMVTTMIAEMLSKMNIPGVWLRNENQFADVVIRTVVWAGESDTQNNEMLLVSPGVATDSRMAMIQGIPNLGGAASKKLLDRFGSIAAICEARPDEIMEVPGVGETTARRIYNTFHTGWDGEPGFDDKHKDMHVWSFLDTHGVGDHILRDVYAGTEGLQKDVSAYLDEEYPEMSENKKQKIIDATEE